MASITEFLEARIAEDEADATADSAEMSRSAVSIQFDCDTQERFNPSRVLVECASKRAVLALHPIRIYTDEEPGFSMELSTCLCQGRPCSTLQALATVYADHPDYRQEWSK